MTKREKAVVKLFCRDSGIDFSMLSESQKAVFLKTLVNNSVLINSYSRDVVRHIIRRLQSILKGLRE